MTPLGPPDSYKKEVMAKKHRFLRFLIVFHSYFQRKMHFLARNVCFSVLATKIGLLQQKILLVAQLGIRQLRLSWQKFCCYS